MIENNKFLIKKMKTKIKMEISDILECMEGNGEVDETEGKKKKQREKKGTVRTRKRLKLWKRGRLKDGRKPENRREKAEKSWEQG